LFRIPYPIPLERPREIVCNKPITPTGEGVKIERRTPLT
jgi:hypothetical protein